MPRLGVLIPTALLLLGAALFGFERTAGAPSDARRVDPREKAGGGGDARSNVIPSFSVPEVDGSRIIWDRTASTLRAGGRLQHPRVFLLHVFQPDCSKCQDLARAVEAFLDSTRADGVAAVGVAHRGDRGAVEEFRRTVGANYPIGVGSKTRFARTWGRGDPFYIVDRRGRIVYQQTGFDDGDPEIWGDVVADLAAGKPVRAMVPKRERLRAGDALPHIRLPNLLDGKIIEVYSNGRSIIFKDGEGIEHKYRAAVGFFSRY